MRDQAEPAAREAMTRPAGSGLVSYGIFGGLSVLALALFSLTIMFFSAFPEDNMASIAIVLGVSASLLGIFALFIFGRLFQVWRSRRVGLAGSRMHLRLVGILSLVALASTFIAFSFSAAVLQVFSDEFFVERVDNANTFSRQLANAYVNSQSQKMGLSVSQLAVDLDTRFEQQGEGIEVSPDGVNQYLLGYALVRGWNAVHILDGERNVLARSEPDPLNPFESADLAARDPLTLPPSEVFDIVDRGEDLNTLWEFRAQDPETLSVYYGILKIQLYGGGYIVVHQRENAVMSQQLRAVLDFTGYNQIFKERLGELRDIFGLAFGLLALIILLLAIWVGMLVAQNIVSPIGRLASAAQNISKGDLADRVEIHQGDGELGDLARIFNDMTGQLETQRDDLISANQQSDLRRRFIEAVLSRVSAGVVGVSSEGRITIANTSAAEFFGYAPGKLQNSLLSDVAPPIAQLFDEARNNPAHEAQGEVDISRDGQSRILTVRIGGSLTEKSISYVVTFDDITNLISAQRNAAWGDVARRIAHEIKNPLTPIQLSAERLQRKYIDEITSNPEVFTRCTDTIIKHVNDIGRMVTEFSSFARMPEPVMARENLREIVRNAVFPFQVAHSDIEFVIEAEDEELTAKCDGRLLVQACTNLIKNAVESIEEGPAADKTKKAEAYAGKVLVRISSDAGNASIDVIDNGKGLPDEKRHHLTEPYMTTREKGTGLGLAIVRKVIEEHGGMLSMRNDTSLGNTGASFSLVFPLEPTGDEASRSNARTGSPSATTKEQESA